MNYFVFKILPILTYILLYFSSGMFFFTESFLHASCASTFIITSNSKGSSTDSFIRYLGELYEIGALNIEDLKRFLEPLKKGEIINPIDSEKAHSNPNATIQQEAIDEFLLEGNFQIEELFRWVSSKLDSEVQTKTARDHVFIKTESAHYPMVFYPVKIPKRIWGISLPHFIRQPSIIEVASTQLTEMQWYEVMGDVVNQSLIRKYHQIERISKNRTEGVYVENRKGEKVLIFPNHPVTEITLWSALVFANTLSMKHNLEPVYDLRDIKFDKNSNAGNGSLQSTNYRISEVPILNPTANGYRIPTRHERNHLIGIQFIPWIAWVFSTRRFEEACDNAWLKHNSDNKIREAASHRPTLIDNHPFFDLIGNTSELEQVVEKCRDKKTKVNQINSAFVHFFVSGGGFQTYKEIIKVMLENNQNPSTFASSWCTGDDIRGFRFVRTIKP